MRTVMREMGREFRSGFIEAIAIAWWMVKWAAFGCMIALIFSAPLLLTGCNAVKEPHNPGVIVEPVTVKSVQYVAIPKELTAHGDVYVRADETVGSYVQADHHNAAALVQCHKQLDDIAAVQGSEK